MRTLKLTIAYDGTRYAGWQVQRHKRPAPSTQHTAHSTQKPTIQGTLEETLGRILQEQVRVVGSGRTDAGVHAHAQVAHLKTRSAIASEKLERAVNGLLPPDITVSRIDEAPESFHAQRQAVSKRYRYTLVIGPAVLPFERSYVHHVRSPLRVARMRRAAQRLRGSHDFRAFCASGSSAKTTRRRLSDVQVTQKPGHLAIELEGNGFLYKMVRGVVGTLLEIGRGRLPEGIIERILRTKDRRLVGPTAPARGLMLLNVSYGD
ncbi:MAG: tRNA pseudouridine(38-40) synthase TruA [Omnitrophica WOR_2 bacterium RIFCSPLOWO2_02_FULL_63_16]|nr:MAG: tRNA pseudouridine(38-40) synthase TruA [Omnitrophica WOR_2 bacterium GWA2_63_20]OGX17343.1 MAG: tRNA pseudouridine(38-40) synthase TruA [Omnitrophica WOR_2 bacterium GWF2_63_9]OGX31378.1 MAG: tRNA pseudouridine(38-40) synthase TruA [Omnitrophica WOR_2 bacterium RIFCSPHIGHO2_12_FULL_64_13]OGX36601.1 MAG: tRNA pseudouridine(38-40) synthase TruA [Omnitrophica WOR_2 bacterium RIFCSPHIGHO2_02_FULL_63_39]OGX46029.1 MAG: tRNA pseudouridine(38-40) synthase TruA [Omnitrophica WOR_2 bacterium RI